MQQMPVMDCRGWRLPMNHLTLLHAIEDFEAVFDSDPELVVMRSEQHDRIKGDWMIDTVVPIGDDQLFINEVFSDDEGRVEHWRSIPIELRA